MLLIGVDCKLLIIDDILSLSQLFLLFILTRKLSRVSGMLGKHLIILFELNILIKQALIIIKGFVVKRIRVRFQIRVLTVVRST
jgi:hypothetical protein